MSREHGSPSPSGWPRGGGPTSPASAAYPPSAPPSSEGRPLRIAGYAALFDKVDGARDTIRPGAFARTLAERSGPYPLYWQHRPDRRIGWVETVGEDARGLRIIASIDKAQGRAARVKILYSTTKGTAKQYAHHIAGRAAKGAAAARELCSPDLLPHRDEQRIRYLHHRCDHCERGRDGM